MLATLGAGKKFGAAGGGGGTQVDTLIRFETSSDGTALTTAIMGAATVGTALTYSVTPATLIKCKISTTGERQVNGLQVSGGTGFGDAGGTRGASILMNGSATQDFVQGTFTAKDKISAGFIFKLGATWDGTDFATYNPVALLGSGGDYCALDFESFTPIGTSMGLKAETQLGTPASPVITAANTNYWVVMIYDRTVPQATISVYTVPGLSLVGSSVQAMTLADQCNAFVFGRYDAHAGSKNESIYLDDIALDLSGAGSIILPNSF